MRDIGLFTSLCVDLILLADVKESKHCTKMCGYLEHHTIVCRFCHR